MLFSTLTANKTLRRGGEKNIYKEGRPSEIGRAISLPWAPLVTGIVHVSRLDVAVTAVLLH